MKRVMWLLFIVLAFMLSGCADSHQTGLEKEVTVKVDVRVTLEAGNTGNVYIAPTGELSQFTGDTMQESAAVAEASPDFTVPIAMQGGQANAESTTEDAEAKQDNRITDSQNDNSTSETVQSTMIPVDDDIIEDDNIENVVLKFGDTRMYSWLKGEGKDYDSPLTVYIPGCGTYVVTDTTKKWTESGDLKDNSGFIYHPGDWPDQDQHGGAVKFASIIAKPGCESKSAILTW